MDSTARYNKAIADLTENNQQHLLAFYDQLDNISRENLLCQVESLDFPEINSWIRDYVLNESPLEVPTNFDPASYYPVDPKDDNQAQIYDNAVNLGKKLLSDGKVAGFVVAGGQGTRLGFDGPKGNYQISQIRKKTLFRLFAEHILAVSAKYGAKIPWYIMTSPLNHSATLELFERNTYYGMDKNDVFIFQQGTNINFSLDGRILLADKCTLASSPDGHGGSLRAIYKSKALQDMQQRGIEQLSYWQVDNPLVHLFDPLFIGLHALEDAGMSSRALIKAHPTEKVGNFCLVDDKVTVIEYSDLPDDQAHRQNPDGSYVFELGSIAIHIVSTSFIDKLNSAGFALPIHRAVKKIPYIDPSGNTVNPDKPNGVKLETFVFDALPLASKSIILETLRQEEFAPVKNASGDDSPDVTRKMMTDRAAAWLEKAGIKVPRKADRTIDCVIEMSANFAVCADDAKAKVETVPRIKSGDSIYLG